MEHRTKSIREEHKEEDKWELYKDTKAEIFWPVGKSGLGKDHLEGKDGWEKIKRKTEKAVGTVRSRMHHPMGISS